MELELWETAGFSGHHWYFCIFAFLITYLGTKTNWLG